MRHDMKDALVKRCTAQRKLLDLGDLVDGSHFSRIHVINVLAFEGKKGISSLHKCVR